MSSSYLTLAQKLRQEVGVSGTGPSAVTSQTGMLAKIVNWVADANDDICSKWLDWGFLHTEHTVNTIVGTKDYSVPSDFGIWDQDSFYLDRTASTYKKLMPMDYWYWRDALRNGSKTNAKPDYVIIKPNKAIILEAPPDAIYSLTADYYKTETRLSGNTATSSIPTKFDRIIICRAKIYYAEHENAPEVMENALNEYNDLLNKLESLYLPEQEPRTRSSNNNMVTIPE